MPPKAPGMAAMAENASAPAEPSYRPAHPFDDLIDRWWSGHVDDFKSGDWARMVNAKEDLKDALALK